MMTGADDVRNARYGDVNDGDDVLSRTVEETRDSDGGMARYEQKMQMVDLCEIGAKWSMAKFMSSEWGVCGLVIKVFETPTNARKNREERSRNDRDMAMFWCGGCVLLRQ